MKLISGGLAGAISRTAVAPLERIIILKQTNNICYQNYSLKETFQKIFKNEGGLSFFKGNYVNCLRIAPFQAIEFLCFDVYKNFSQNLQSNSEFKIHQAINYLLCGALSGMTAQIVCYPLDLTKTMLAINTSNYSLGVLGTMKSVVKTEGYLGMYKGLLMSCIGITPYAALKLTFFQLQKNLVYGKQADKVKIPTYLTLTMGAVAGCAAVTITYPTDFIRRRLQVSMMRQNKQGITTFVKKIINNEGFLTLYTGLFPTYCKILPSTSLAFGANELFKQKLLKQMY